MAEKRSRGRQTRDSAWLAALCVFAATALHVSAGEVCCADVFRMLREKGIAFNSNAVRRAAVAAVLAEVDPRSVLLSPEEVELIDAGETVKASELWAEGIAYLQLGGIYKGGASNIQSRVQEWSGEDLTGLIVDLRGAAGTSLECVEQICGMFVPAGVPLYEIAGGGEENETRSAPTSQLPGVPPPLMLITDGATRDAGEVLCLALKGRPGVMMIGKPTLGDGGLREPVELATNVVAYVATRWVQPVGTNDFKGLGVLPDIEIPQALPDGGAAVRPENGSIMKPLSAKARMDRELMLRVADDPPLLRAVDILLGLKALRPRDNPSESTDVEEEPTDG